LFYIAAILPEKVLLTIVEELDKMKKKPTKKEAYTE
jgi:hypothetical protein